MSPNGLKSIYGGNEGVFVETILGNTDIKPERTTEYEGGVDIAFLDNRLSFGATYYYQRTKDAILDVDVAPSTGFFSKFANAAEFENEGWELMAAQLPPSRSQPALRRDARHRVGHLRSMGQER